jgi:hypothetical protein
LRRGKSTAPSSLKPAVPVLSRPLSPSRNGVAAGGAGELCKEKKEHGLYLSRLSGFASNESAATANLERLIDMAQTQNDNAYRSN